MVIHNTDTQGSAYMGKDATDGDEYRNTKINKYRNTNIQKYRNTDIQGYTNTESYISERVPRMVMRKDHKIYLSLTRREDRRQLFNF